jgi:hypothetical protein
VRRQDPLIRVLVALPLLGVLMLAPAAIQEPPAAPPAAAPAPVQANDAAPVPLALDGCHGLRAFIDLPAARFADTITAGYQPRHPSNLGLDGLARLELVDYRCDKLLAPVFARENVHFLAAFVHVDESGLPGRQGTTHLFPLDLALSDPDAVAVLRPLGLPVRWVDAATTPDLLLPYELRQRTSDTGNTLLHVPTSLAATASPVAARFTVVAPEAHQAAWTVVHGYRGGSAHYLGGRLEASGDTALARALDRASVPLTVLASGSAHVAWAPMA